jgi:hypothetical protein
MLVASIWWKKYAVKMSAEELMATMFSLANFREVPRLVDT